MGEILQCKDTVAVWSPCAAASMHYAFQGEEASTQLMAGSISFHGSCSSAEESCCSCYRCNEWNVTSSSQLLASVRAGLRGHVQHLCPHIARIRVPQQRVAPLPGSTDSQREGDPIASHPPRDVLFLSLRFLPRAFSPGAVSACCHVVIAEGLRP